MLLSNNYRLIINTGLSQLFFIVVLDISEDGKIKDEENCYNIKTMEKLKNLC